MLIGARSLVHIAQYVAKRKIHTKLKDLEVGSCLSRLLPDATELGGTECVL